jgi:hypothetical protein
MRRCLLDALRHGSAWSEYSATLGGEYRICLISRGHLRGDRNAASLLPKL